MFGKRAGIRVISRCASNRAPVMPTVASNRDSAEAITQMQQAQYTRCHVGSGCADTAGNFAGLHQCVVMVEGRAGWRPRFVYLARLYTWT